MREEREKRKKEDEELRLKQQRDEEERQGRIAEEWKKKDDLAEQMGPRGRRGGASTPGGATPDRITLVVSSVPIVLKLEML